MTPIEFGIFFIVLILFIIGIVFLSTHLQNKRFIKVVEDNLTEGFLVRDGLVLTGYYTISKTKSQQNKEIAKTVAIAAVTGLLTGVAVVRGEQQARIILGFEPGVASFIPEQHGTFKTNFDNKFKVQESDIEKIVLIKKNKNRLNLGILFIDGITYNMWLKPYKKDVTIEQAISYLSQVWNIAINTK